MIYCPYCDTENIEGVDECADCGQPLDDLHLTAPQSEVERSLLLDRLSALQPRSPIMVPDTMTVKQTLEMLVENDIGCVFISRGESVVGVFTERDAYMRLNVDAAKHFDEPISNFMTAAPRTLADSAKVAFAVQMMDQGGYRHVLIVDQDGKPNGVTSARDILRYLAERVATVSS